MLNKLLTTVLFTALSATAFAQGASDAKTAQPTAAKPAQVAPAAEKGVEKVADKAAVKVEHKSAAKAEVKPAVAKEVSKEAVKDAKPVEPVKVDLQKAIQEQKAAPAGSAPANPFAKPAEKAAEPAPAKK